MHPVCTQTLEGHGDAVSKAVQLSGAITCTATTTWIYWGGVPSACHPVRVRAFRPFSALRPYGRRRKEAPGAALDGPKGVNVTQMGLGYMISVIAGLTQVTCQLQSPVHHKKARPVGVSPLNAGVMPLSCVLERLMYCVGTSIHKAAHGIMCPKYP